MGEVFGWGWGFRSLGSDGVVEEERLHHPPCVASRLKSRRADVEAEIAAHRSPSIDPDNRSGARERLQTRLRAEGCVEYSHRGGVRVVAGAGGRRRIVRGAAVVLLVILVALGGEAARAEEDRRQGFDEEKFNALSSKPKPCSKDANMWCSRCENTTQLWLSSGVDPNWITFDQIFRLAGTPTDVEPRDGSPIVRVNGQNFENNQYHYFEFIVQGGDGAVGDDTRRDMVHFMLVSPGSIKVANGAMVANSEYAARKPAYDFFVGQNCIPQERNWNNQGYGNRNANELVKAITVNVTRDARYFIALQSRRQRYGVATYDSTMNLTRGALTSRFKETRCTALVYRYPDQIATMQAQFRQTGVVGKQLGGAIPPCGETPQDLRYNVQYILPTPKPGLSQETLAIVVGAACGAVIFLSLVAGTWLYVRYKRTTRRMAKFSSLSRGLPDALMDGEGQEVAV